MRPLGTAVIRAGLVDASVLAELNRWGLPLHVIPEGTRVIEDPDLLIRVLQDALESGDQVRIQDTDLDVVTRWLSPENQKEGKLILITDEGAKSTTRVRFCWSLMKEVIIPWRSESIVDLLGNGRSHMTYTDERDVRHKVFFSDVREIYIGDTKAFVVCDVDEDEEK